MGCFFGCFRLKDSTNELVAPSEPVAPPRSKNALSSLFLTDDEPVGNEEEGQKQLEDEAKFLKACGTLPNTPVKSQNSLEKWEALSAPNTVGSPMPGSGSFLDSPSSCMTDGRITQSSTKRRDVQNVDMCDSQTLCGFSSVSTEAFSSTEQCQKKSVRFNYALDGSALSSHSSSSEFVLDPAEDSRKELKDETSYSNLPSVSVKLNDEENNKEEMKVDESLTSWFKPIPVQQDNNNKRLCSITSENVHRRKVPADRPILGMVAAHWNDVDDDETSHMPPEYKWWDGNGIPNSTNKYKEDQKVSWHATPFEERLEKALSEETFLSKKKPINGTPPFDLDESEESDTAISHMQSSAHLKSVVSF